MHYLIKNHLSHGLNLIVYLKCLSPVTEVEFSHEVSHLTQIEVQLSNIDYKTQVINTVDTLTKLFKLHLNPV